MNKCIFKCKQVLGKKVTGEWLRLSRRVFTCSQRASIFSSKKTKNSGCFTATPFAASFHLSATGSHFFFEKNVKTRAVLQAKPVRRAFACTATASAQTRACDRPAPEASSRTDLMLTARKTYFLEVTSVQELQCQEVSFLQGIQEKHRHL